MRFLRHLYLPAVIVACLLTGCSLHRSVHHGAIVDADVELADTPFFPQRQYQCGPAALATVLKASGVASHPDDLTPRLYLPGRKGSLQPELIAAIRSSQRIPSLVKPEITAIAAELQVGRPVLVLQNLGLKIVPVYHYAVVVGMQAGGRIVLRSGTIRRLVMDLDDFLKSWEKAGSWAVVVLNREELPADLDVMRYLETIAEIEAMGNSALAEGGYRSVLNRFPDQPVALFGLANTLFAGKRLSEAARIYRELLNRQPTHAAAANNLAETLAGLHCFRQALELLDAFLSSNDQSDLTSTLTATRQEIEARRQAEGGSENRPPGSRYIDCL
jgi:tetratricopeptide (TPR) repeat protein